MGRRYSFPQKISIIPLYGQVQFHKPIATAVKRLDKSEAFMRTLKPVLLSLVVVGIQTPAFFKSPIKKNNNLSIKWWNIIALIYLHLFSLKTITTIALTSGGLGFWMQMSTFVRSSVATISADIYISKRHKLYLFIQNMNFVFVRLRAAERKKFQKRVTIHSVVLWIFVVLNAIMMIVNVYQLGMEKFLDVHFFSARITFIPPTSQYVVGGILLVIRHSIMWGTLSFTVLLYATLCDGMKRGFRSVNQAISRTFQNPKTLEASEVRELQQHYIYVVDLLAQMDDVFSPIVFFWSSAFILSVCIDITFDISMYGKMDTVSFLASIQKIVLLLMAYIAVGLSAALAVEEEQRCLPLFHKVTADFDAAHDVRLSQAIQFFALKLSSTQVALTGWRFFELSRSYMLTLFGILGSFMIIVFQLNPHAMATLIIGS